MTMKNCCAGALIAACAVVLTLFFVRNPAPAEAQAVVKGPQWEYKVVAWGSGLVNPQNPNERDASALSRHFTGLAEDGWEYTRDLNPGGYSVFKRAKRAGDK
jgi:hypothetical protein